MAEPGTNCRSSCRTRDHRTFGECARAANVQIDRHSLSYDIRKERNKDNRLARYASLRKHGIQPEGTGWSKIRYAEEHGSVPDNPLPLSTTPYPVTPKE